MLPGPFVAQVSGHLDLCRDGWRENPQEVTCSVCGARNLYDVGPVLVSQDRGGSPQVTFVGYFRCHSCGAGGPWTSPDLDYLALSAIAGGVLGRAFGSKSPGGLGEIELFDGHRPRSSADAEEHLLDLLLADPLNAQHFVRLANVYLTGGRPDLAMAAAERALDLEPDHFEALLLLIGHMLRRLDPAEAARHLRHAVAVARRYRALPLQEMRKLLAAALTDLMRIHRNSGDEIPFFPSEEETGDTIWTRMEETTIHIRARGDDAAAYLPLASLLLSPDRTPPDHCGPKGDLIPSGREPWRREPGPGRNEPCPCGSGRRYKHCCGRDAWPQIPRCPGCLPSPRRTPRGFAPWAAPCNCPDRSSHSRPCGAGRERSASRAMQPHLPGQVIRRPTSGTRPGCPRGGSPR